MSKIAGKIAEALRTADICDVFIDLDSSVDYDSDKVLAVRQVRPSKIFFQIFQIFFFYFFWFLFLLDDKALRFGNCCLQ